MRTRGNARVKVDARTRDPGGEVLASFRDVHDALRSRRVFCNGRRAHATLYCAGLGEHHDSDGCDGHGHGHQHGGLWLGVYALPRLRRGEVRSLPAGIAVSFAAIVLVWPWLIPWRHLLAD